MLDICPVILSALLISSTVAAVPLALASSNNPPPGEPDRRVWIVEDQDAGAFRFIIDGQDVARLDATGIHVFKNITYGGTMVDTGTDHLSTVTEDVRNAN